MTLHTLSSAVTRKVLTSDDVSELSAEDCSVCSIRYIVKDVTRRLPACGHVFHENCLWKLVKKGYPCPTCRTPVHPDLMSKTTIGRRCNNRPMNPKVEQSWLDFNVEIKTCGSPKETMVKILKLAPGVKQYFVDLENWEAMSREYCPLCRGEYLPCDIISIAPHCQHMFHAQCAWKWFKKHESCKFCETSLRRTFMQEDVMEIPDCGGVSSTQTQDGASHRFRVDHVVHRI